MKSQQIAMRCLASLTVTLTLSSVAMAQTVNEGQRFYEKVCAKCHETGIGPVLMGRGFNEAVYTTIARNGNRAMPAFRISDIDDATLQQLATYLTNAPAKPAPGAAK